MLAAVIFAVQEEERRKAAAVRLKRKGGKLTIQNAAEAEAEESTTAASEGTAPEEPKDESGLSEEEVAMCRRYLKNRFLIVPGHAFPNVNADIVEVIPSNSNQLNYFSLVCKSKVRQAAVAAAAAAAEKKQEEKV